MAKEIKEEDLIKRSEDLDAREQGLIKRENEVSNLENIRKKLESDYVNKTNSLNTLEQNIYTEKTKTITEKNNEIKKLDDELSKINKDIIDKKEELARLKAQLEVEVDETKNKKLIAVEEQLIAKIERDTKKIQDEYANYLKSATDTVQWSEEKLKKAFNDLIAEFKKLLESKEKIVQDKIEDLNKAKEDYEKAIENNSHIQEEIAKLNIKEKQLDTKEKMLQRLIDSEANKRAKDIAEELKVLKDRYEQIIQEKNQLGIEYQKMVDSANSHELIDKLELESRVRNLAKINEELVTKFGQYSSSEFEELKLKASRLETIQKENVKLQLEIRDLQNKVDVFNSSQENVDHLKHENEQLLNKIRVERLLSIELKNQIEELASRIENVKSGIIASETIEIPYPQFRDCEQSTSSKNEVEWIGNIIDLCKESGFEFSKRLFYSFHTALKTSDMSPLTVLAGVSGTGKSKLPQLYSRFGGLYFISVPVQPDWDSPQSLFGYFNSIEKRFNATSLLRALVSFQADKSKSETKDNILDLSNNVLIVLLDEMNLAHVELYFSDLLSKLEERRGESKDIGFEVDLGAGNEKYSIILTDNVKWVGTMNEDETTKSLSDKVVDRGNVISFPRPEKFERYNNKQLAPEQAKIQREVWNNWVNDKTELTDEEANIYMNIVEGINDALKNVNRALGHRVWQSIENYMISHPLVSEFKDDEDKRKKALNYAFEEALVHKIMPKLRGIDTTGEQREKCLDVIEEILRSNELTTIIGDYENAMKSVTETFIWDSAKYLSEDYKME